MGAETALIVSAAAAVASAAVSAGTAIDNRNKQRKADAKAKWAEANAKKLTPAEGKQAEFNKESSAARGVSSSYTAGGALQDQEDTGSPMLG